MHAECLLPQHTICPSTRSFHRHHILPAASFCSAGSLSVASYVVGAQTHQRRSTVIGCRCRSLTPRMIQRQTSRPTEVAAR